MTVYTVYFYFWSR